MGTKSTGDKKTAKKGKIRGASKIRGKVIAILVAAFFILSIFFYFANSIGLAARVLTGANVAGQRVSVTRMNYFYYSVFNMYAQYGIITSPEDLDVVINQETGETYRGYFRRSSAETWQQMLLLEARMRAEGYTSQTAQRAADEAIADVRSTAESYNMTADQFLANSYGRGMTVRTAWDIIYREQAAQEFASALMQSAYAVTADEAQVLFDEDPGKFAPLTFNIYAVSAELPGDAASEEDTDSPEETPEETTAAESTEPTEAPVPTEEAIQAAVAKAQGIIDAATDPESFVAAAKEAAGAAGEESFADDADPTIRADYSRTSAENYFGEDVANFVSAKERVEGDKTVIQTEYGAYAVFFQSRTVKEDPTVTYRKITLALEAGSKVSKDEQFAELRTQLESLMDGIGDEASFSAAAKTESADTTALSGGLVSNATASSFTLTETETDEEGDDVEMVEPAHDDLLYAWLFEAGRASGEMMILENSSNDSISLYFFVHNLPSWQSSVMSSVSSERYNDWFETTSELPNNGISINSGIWDFAS